MNGYNDFAHLQLTMLQLSSFFVHCTSCLCTFMLALGFVFGFGWWFRVGHWIEFVG
jgi:hypothetical protein